MSRISSNVSSVFTKNTELRSSSRSSSRVKVTEPGEASFRVYYGATGAAVPFVWESQPGTPKHPIFDKLNDQIAPPLTPPPSYKSPFSSRKEISCRSSWSFSTLFSRRRRSVSHVTPTSSSSSSYSEHIRSWSISSSSSSTVSFSSPHFTAGRKKHMYHKRSISASSFCFSGHKSLLGDDVEDSGLRSSPSSTMCFGFRKKQGGYTMGDVKNAILSI